MICLIRKQLFKYSELVHFHPQTQKMLSPFMVNNTTPLQFHKSTLQTNWFYKLAHTKSVANKFQYMLKYIQQCTLKSNSQNMLGYDKIQTNLKQKIQLHLKSRKQKIIIHQCIVERLQFLEQTKVYGVFMHRNLNLPKQCYSTEVTKRHQVKYRLKNNLKSESHLKQVNPIRKKYDQQHYQKFYLDSYEYFQKNDYLIRSIIRIRANVKAELIKQNNDDHTMRMGYSYPTQHILQFQTIENSYRKQNYLITDIDCFMSGNYYFPK